MKSFLRNMFAVFVSVLMMIGMGVTAFADDTTYTITINNTASGHTYEAYQVFSGTLDETGTVLSNIQWGTGVDSAALLTALQSDKTTTLDFSACTDAASVAKVLSDNNTNADAAKAFAQLVGQHLATNKKSSTEKAGPYTITGLAAGYYLVKDKDSTQKDVDDSYTSFILKVAGNVSADPKGTIPTVEKKVQENVKYTDNDGYGAGYNDVADYNIGDAVPFELIGTLPENYADYTTYNYVFHDTASAGLTIDKDSVKVYAGTTDITTSFTAVLDGQKLTVSCANLKAISSLTLTASSKIVVKYNATLNSSAVIGLDGNPNEVYLTYSNNPNQGGSGDTGKTPTDKVIVFTYELDTTKVDASDAKKKLAGAEFELYKTVGTTTTYETVADGKVTGWTADETKATQLTSDAEGLFKVAGLDDGTYYLKETTAPTGYNKLIKDVKLVIAATTTNGQNWTTGTASTALTALSISIDDGTATNGDTATGVVNATVADNKGATLPSTGGIGTTIFYVIGGAMVIAAGVLLVARKRSEN